ncbi:MAG: AAA family ATPase [Steroidobacteraceae bacterium]
MNSLSGRLILVCGVAGVGKTRLIKSTVERDPTRVVWSAGEIIGEARRIDHRDLLRTLPADELMHSQELLVRGIQARRVATPDAIVLLDGHSVIDTDQGLFDVPLDIVRRLAPMGVIYVSDRVEQILERRRADAARARPERSLAQLSEYQDRSIARCRDYQKGLTIPLSVVTSGDEEGFDRAVGSMLEASRR